MNSFTEWQNTKSKLDFCSLQVDSSKLAGKFGMLLNTTSYVDQDFMSTLGNLTFNQFAPIDQKVKLQCLEQGRKLLLDCCDSLAI